MIDRLYALPPEDRPALLQETYDRNMAFFRRHMPELLNIVKKKDCPYQLNITPEFLSITHGQTGKLAHPEAGLDKFAAMMGDWVHDAWVDLCNFKVPAMDQYPLHGKPLRNLYRELLMEFPETLIRFSRKEVNLKELPDGRRFSPPVIFLGIFHGLHIDYYLSRSEVSHILLVEPDTRRFEVSCYFLDYQGLAEKADVVFSLGPDPQSAAIRYFFSNYHVSRSLWTRVLPAYEDPANPHLVESFRMHQSTMSDVVFPLDHDYDALRQIAANIRQKRNLLTSRPRLSSGAQVALVASGPSLDRDIAWLRENQEHLIIFAVFSAVKPLLRQGIRPDFQVTLETILREDGLSNPLGLDPDIPVIAGCNAPISIVRYFKNLLLCGIGDKVAPVRFTLPVHRVLPSSASMALSIALLGNPEELYLVGCDFGYASKDHTHAGQTIYDKKTGDITVEDYLSKMEQIVAEPNFKTREGQYITSSPFLSHVRLVFEQAIALAGKTAVYNLSHGARIKGAQPRHSETIRLKKYSRKQDDVARILKAFRPAEKGINWKPYRNDSSTLVENFKQDVLRGLVLDKFSWKQFNRAVDQAVLDQVIAHRENEMDRRPEVFVLFMIHLLTAWYKVLLFSDDLEQAERIYRSGLDKLGAQFRELSWPVRDPD
ncbi:motility associated factor glycosyltransferase family protein [Desulfolithobacter sp.]